ncbi:MAG: hypothetical protein ABSF67_03785 [Roseiarcus sp.]
MSAARATLRAVVAAAAIGFAALAAALPRSETTSTPSWPPLKDSSSWTSVCNRLKFPSGATVNPHDSSSTNSNASHVECVSPPYATRNIKLLFTAFDVALDGRANPEVCAGNPVAVDFATIFIGGTPYPVTFNGAQSVTVQNCGFVWSDPLRDASGNIVSIPAGTQYFIRTSQTVGPNQGLPSSQGVGGTQPCKSNATVGDGSGFYTSVQTSLRNSGTVPACYWGSTVVTASMAIGQGWDGSAVYALVGDSICYGQNDNDYSAPALGGFMARALDDSTSGRRNFYEMCFSGTGENDQASLAPGAWRLRMAALRAIPNIPFNAILSQMGENSFAFGAGLPQFMAVESNFWRFWRGVCPQCKIFQTSFQARPNGGDGSTYTAYTTLADQVTGYPTDSRSLINAYFANNNILPYGVVGLDVTSAFTTGSGFTSAPGKWPVTGWSGTLAAAVSAYQSTISVNSATSPTVGDDIVLDVGASNYESVGVAGVSGASSPWAVTLGGTVGTPNNTLKAHSSGAALGLALTQDGDHPSASLYKSAANALIALKNSGALP